MSGPADLAAAQVTFGTPYSNSNIYSIESNKKGPRTCANRPGVWPNLARRFDVSNDIPEQWRPVVGYEDLYEVSDRGRVRSLGWYIKQGSGARWHPGRMMTPYHSGHGNGTRSDYHCVTLSDSGKRKHPTVHKIVCEAFIGPRPDNCPDIRHLNGDPTDNRLENLVYGTKSENQYDRVRHGRHRFANQTHCKQGHEFTPENTRIYNGHWRICKTCKRSPSLTRKRSWTAAEIEVVSRPDLSHTEMAEILGRTVNAVGAARSRLKNDPAFRRRMTVAA